jgi:hypothetical protein
MGLRPDGVEQGGLAEAGRPVDQHDAALAGLQGAEPAAELVEVDLPPP